MSLNSICFVYCRQSAWKGSFVRFLSLVGIVFLTSCGGGSSSIVPGPTVSQCPPFVDSFGRSVSCVEMGALPGANLPYLESIAGSGGDGDGDGAADGTAGDGAGIANATIKFIDVNGKEVNAVTDTEGYYRINLRGLKAPLVATVMRSNAPWKSVMVEDIVRAPSNRRFYTINLTGLTDWTVSEIAKKGVIDSPEDITPAVALRLKANVREALDIVRKSICGSLDEDRLDKISFNPFSLPFRPNKTGYDRLLEKYTFLKIPGRLTTATAKQLYVNIVDINSSLAGTGPLANSPYDGIQFLFNGQVATVRSPAIAAAKTYAELLAAFKTASAAVPLLNDVSTSMGSAFTVSDPATGASVQGRTINLTSASGGNFSPAKLLETATTSSALNVYACAGL